jgi:hypothetical protein
MIGVFRSALCVLLLSFGQLALSVPTAVASPLLSASTNTPAPTNGAQSDLVGLPTTVTMAWNSSPDGNVAGYFLCWGLASGQCTNRLDVGNATSGVLSGLQPDVVYYLTVVAYDGAGRESPPSNEVAYSTTVAAADPAAQPSDAPYLQPLTQTSGVLTLAWTAVPGERYQVQYKSDLIQTNWANLCDPITATNASTTASDPIGPDLQRFYRIIVLQQ